MKTFSDLFSDSLIKAFGWTLVHSVWQAFAMMLLAAGAFYVLKKKTAQTRYLTAIGFLLIQFGASLATFLYYLSKTNAAATLSSTFQIAAGNITVTTASPIRYSLPPALKMQFWLNAHLNELVICWLIGAGLLLLKFLGSWVFTERLRLSAHNVMDKEWRARFGLMVAKMQISQSVDFKETAKVKTPMVLGTFSPVILIPIGLLSGFSVSQVEAILAHELAHIKRHDYLVNLLQSMLEVVFFFHPAIWWLSDRIRIEREHCCDDIALEVCGDKMSLAHALVKVAEWQSSPALAMAFASKRPLLLNRIQRVLGVSTPKRERNFGYLSVMLLAMSLIAGISVYATAQKSEKQKAKKTAKAKVKTHSASTTKSIIAKMEAGEDIEEFPDMSALELAEFGVPVDVDLNINTTDFGIPDFALFGTGNDTIDRKINEIQKRIEVLQQETEPLQQRMEEMHLEMEKHQFQVDRFQREREKIEWKKSEALERRSELMEKSREVFENRNENKKEQNQNVNVNDIDKQVADFEQQIKAQEEIVSQLNAQLSTLRKDILKAEEPIRAMNPEMQDINSKMEDISAKIGRESEAIEKLEISSRPRVAQAPRKPTTRKSVRIASPPPPPPAAANPAKPAKAPVPPAPPAKK